MTVRKRFFRVPSSCVWAQDADTKGERANKPVRTKAQKTSTNQWVKSKGQNRQKVSGKPAPNFVAAWLVTCFFSCELLRNCLVADELESWGQLQYDIGFHWLNIASYTVAGPTFIPTVRFLFCCEANMKTPWYYWIVFQAPVNLSHFFPKMIRLVRKSFRSTTSILTGRILRSRELSSMGPVIHWQLQMYVSQALVSRHSLEDGKFSVGCLKIVKGCGVTIPMEEPPRIQRGEDSRTTVMIRNLVGISARKVGTHGW